MSFPTVKSYSAINPITGLTVQPLGAIFHPPRVNQGPSRGSWKYAFFASGTSTPQNVYQNATLTTPFAPTGVVTADAFGRFPAIYLDNTVAYKVQLQNSLGVVQQTRDPYNPAMATTGQAQIVASQGLIINPQGELSLTEAGAGGSGFELTVNAGLNGALKVQGVTPGVATLIADNTVTTGAQTALFNASNMPPSTNLNISVTLVAPPSGATYTGGTLNAPFTGISSNLYTAVLSTGQVILGATLTNGQTTFTVPSTNITGTPTATIVLTFNVGVAGWLPVQCDGTTYFTPLFHTSPFTPYQFHGNSYSGSTINCSANTNTVQVVGNNIYTYPDGGPLSFNSNGTITVYGISSIATPPQYFNPPTAGIGTNTWINFTITSSGSGNNSLNVGAGAPGSWVNIAGGININLTAGTTGIGVTSGTYQLSSSSSGSPVVGSGTFTIAPTTSLYPANHFGFTETIPSGPYQNVLIECWGCGGPPASSVGAGGGAGGYCRSIYSISSLGGAGKTFNVVQVSYGATFNTNITAGTVTGFSAMTANNGSQGSGNIGGAGGTATGGNQTNITGSNGTTGPNGGRTAGPSNGYYNNAPGASTSFNSFAWGGGSADAGNQLSSGPGLAIFTYF